MESIKSPTRQIRSQLEILLHCKKCFSQPCDVPNCGEFKNVLIHMNSCKEGRACQGVHCASSSQILRHWDSCQNDNCVLCSPIRDNIKLAAKYADSAKAAVRTSDASFQNWIRKANTEHVPELIYQRNHSENGGFYSSGGRTDNLSDEMKLAIRDAVQAAMNSMMPQLEAMVRTAIRSEIASLILGQGQDRRLQSPKPVLATPAQYPAATTPSHSTQYEKVVTSPMAPQPISKPVGADSPRNQHLTMTPPSQQLALTMTPPSQQPTQHEQHAQHEQLHQVASPHYSMTPTPEQMVTPVSAHLNMAPPVSDHHTLTSPLSAHINMAPPVSDHHTLTPPLSAHINMVPPVSAHHSLTPPLSAHLNMAPLSSHSMTATSHHSMTLAPPAPQRNLTSPVSNGHLSPASGESYLNTQHSGNPLDNQQPLTSQLLAPLPQQHFANQSPDQFMSLQSELHSSFF